ncbi:chromatin-remodeling ATPase INO80-like isoform X3 [Leptopilina heterotoma]|uniref:chromatin-remodeling ATPase INO80-like isoform X3 n=1 Tax=Leptopilina heterotoma TaxID=63436 RepID=UPI001CA9CD31|nr:chromatin-remodeling ATPase INO80-like isoform X3 [Leptopilina heterotoma]
MIDLKQKLEEAQNLIKLLQGNLNSTQGLSSKRKLTFSGTSQNVPSTSLNRKEIISSDDGVDLIVTDFMADNNKIVEKAIHSDLQKKSRKLSPDSESDDSMHDGDYDPTKYMRPALTQILQPQSESDDSMNDSDITRRNLINTIQTEAQVHNPRSEMDGLMKDDDNEFENTSSNAPSPLLRRHPSKFVKLSKATSVNTEEIEVLQDSDDSTKGTEDNFHLFSPQPTSKSYISQSGDESMNEGAKLQGNNVSPSSQKNNNDNSNSASEIQKSSHKKNKKQVIVNLESDDSSDDCTIPVKKQKVRKAESKEKSVKHKITKRDRKFMKDSDSEESESEKETIKKYSIVTETKKSGRKVEKVYLGKEEYIKKDTWDAINTLDDSKFVKYLAAAIWTRSVLVNRCIKNTGRLIPLPDRSPRKLLTPKKKSVVEACFNDYLDERKVHGVEKGTRLKKCGYYISQHIGSLRSQLYPEMSQNNKKHTQEPDSEEED